MAAWLVPALKAVLPHIGTLISVAVPVFTKKSPGAGDSTAVLQQQITELQAASSQNAANVRALAEHLQSTVMALEQAAVLAEKRLRRVYLYCLAAAGVCTFTLGLSVYLLLSR